MDTGAVIPRKRLEAVLCAITRRNAGQVRGVIASDVDDAGAYTEAWPLYAQCYYAAVALRAGVEVEAALESVKKVFDLKMAGGLDWFFPITFGGKDNAEVGWGRWYMSAPAIWYVAAAFHGVTLDRVAGTLSVAPDVCRGLDSARPLPVCFPGLWCSLFREGDQIVLRVDRIDKELRLKQVSLKGGGRVAKDVLLRAPGDEIRLGVC